MDFNFADFFSRAVIQGTPLLYGSVGEIITEKSGHLNLGIAGIMYVGGISGVIGAFFYQQAVPQELMNPFLSIIIPTLSSILGSLFMGLIYAFLTVTLRANQNVTGLALTTFGIGIGNFFGGSLIKLTNSDVPSINITPTSNFFRQTLPFAEDLGFFGKMFFSYTFMVYLAIAIAVIAAVVLKRTKVGLRLRAVGENPATADAAGINVNRYKYTSICVGSIIAGLGGLFYVVDYIGSWSNDGFGDRGWLAIALVIFAVWRPHFSIPGAFVFGGLYILYNYVQSNDLATQELFKMAPYLVTIIVLIMISLRKKRETQPPAALGTNYFREDR
ncbi:MAG: ABC transporter permease [Clostridia bacterium]|nr:ABC transporter permease [Clostridia bacterium]